MNPTSSTLLSGMNAAGTRLQVSAFNIANLNTQDFNRQEAKQSEQIGGGTTVTVSNSLNASGSNLETDMVQQLVAKNSFLANLSVFKANDAMLGTLLDTSI